MSSNIIVPSMVTSFNLGGDTSTSKVWPLGTNTLSPSAGGNSPPHVALSDHLSMYKNLLF